MVTRCHDYLSSAQGRAQVQKEGEHLCNNKQSTSDFVGTNDLSCHVSPFSIAWGRHCLGFVEVLVVFYYV